MKKTKVKLHFGYNCETHEIFDCNILSERLSLTKFLEREEVLAILKDLQDFNIKRLKDYIETETALDKEFVSRSDTRTYVARVQKSADGNIEFILFQKPTVWAAKRFMYILAALIVVAVIGICGSVVLSLSKDMKEKSAAEAENTIQMISEQIDGTISTEFNSWFNELKMVSALISKFDETEGHEEEIDLILNDIRVGLPFNDIGLLSGAGDIYFKKDVSYSIFYEELAKNLVIENNAAVDVLTINGSDIIAFGIPVENNNSLSDSKIAAVCGFSVPSRVNKLLNIGLFDNTSVIAVYNNDGFSVSISENAKAPQNADSLNFFTDLESKQTKENYTAIEQNFLAGNSGLFNQLYGDSNYYVYYSKIHFSAANFNITDAWHIVIYVPETAIFSNVNSIMDVVIKTLIWICVVIVTVTILLIALFITKRDNDIIMKKQATANKLLEIAADSAVEASQAKTVFLSNMSHDIRTPINGIIGMTEIAKKHIDDEATVKDCLSKIDGASSHLLSLVNDVLDMSRIENGKVEIVNEVMNIIMTADECCSIIYGQLAERKIEFSFIKKNIVHADVLGDNLHLKQILINILGNSVKFTPDGGKITFTVEEKSFENDLVTYEFTVEDTGCGMSEEFMKVIFQPFSQEKNAGRTHYKGTGLGLAISSQLAQLMHGSIGVFSKLNEGSRFVVTMPFALSKEKVGESDKKLLGGELRSFKGVRVLLVEDNELNSELETILLTESGMIVETAENGRIALDTFISHDAYYYDCILMDVMMPEMDGLTATTRIRSSNKEDAKTIPIIAMTANAFESDIRNTREAGMDAHISKPIYIEEVLKVLGRLLAKKHY